MVESRPLRSSAETQHAICFADQHDAPELARLLTLLGHRTSADAIDARWRPWQTAGNTALVVAKDDSSLAAVATLNQTIVLHRAQPVGRITALVVDVNMRGKGIGRALVAAAEGILASAGCGLLEITSNQQLVKTHEFYQHLGYERVSIRLAKWLK